MRKERREEENRPDDRDAPGEYRTPRGMHRREDTKREAPGNQEENEDKAPVDRDLDAEDPSEPQVILHDWYPLSGKPGHRPRAALAPRTDCTSRRWMTRHLDQTAETPVPLGLMHVPSQCDG